MSLRDTQQGRPKSFSRYGQRLERQIHPVPVKLNPNKAVEVRSFIKHLVKPTFETISRQTKSPFTLFHSKDTQNVDYKVNYQGVRPNQPRINISSTQALTFTEKAASQSLKEFSIDKNEYPPLTQREMLQKSRKKLHHLDFDRHSQRKMGPQPEAGMRDPELRYNNFDEQSMSRRCSSVHSFRGYTARRDLYQSNNRQYRSKDVSNVHEIDMNKLRKRWSSSSGFVPFDKLASQIKLRSDRDCHPWLTKLQYSPRETDHRTVWRFNMQSERKPNEVHSKYPMRICV